MACRNCGKSGHNRRTCGRKSITELAQQRPQPIADRVPRGQRWTFDETIERQFTERTSAGAAIEQIIQAFHDAEHGFVCNQVDLFEKRIESDAHLWAALSNRNEAVSQKPFTIEPGGTPGRESEEDRRAASDLEELLGNVPNFVSTIEHQLEFNAYGYSGSEIIWDMVETSDGRLMAAPVWFQDIAHRRFTFEKETDRPMLRTSEDPTDGEPLQPGKWWWTCRRGRLVAMSGLMRCLIFWSTFKVLGMRDFMVFAERFGIPYVTGEYDDSITDEDKEVLRAAVRDLGSDGFAIFSNAAKIVMHELKSMGSANSAEGIHGTLISICDTQISRLVEGATLVSSVDGPGSHALGKVHQNRYFDILLGDAERISKSFEASVGLPFVKFNGLNARPPRLKMHLGLNMSPADQIDMVIKMANNLEGFEADEDQLRRLTLAKKPSEGQGLRGLEFAKIDSGIETGEPLGDA